VQAQMASNQKFERGTLDGSTPDSNNWEVQVINGLAHRIHRVTVHTFLMGDVEDPDLYAAEPLLEWQNSEEGKWVMAHAIASPEWHRIVDYQSFGFRYAIVAKLRGRDYTFWTMKWGTK
jgi:hypothetical protein